MTEQFDVFLCHNHLDKPEVQTIKNELLKAGLQPFLDESDLPIGSRWSDYLVTAMDQSRSAAIFLGNHGLGNTQKKEIKRLEGNHFDNSIPFIPVYLPNAPKNINWEGFNFIKYVGVDFRSGGDSDPMEKLIQAIRVTNPQINQPRSPEPQIKQDYLPSEKGVDYTRLRDLLKTGSWKEADQETARLMLKVANRETEGWLDSDSIKKFPCTDLRTIDQLWVKYSNGHFGFSVQKRIWESVGKDYEKFGDRVGWRKVRATGMFFNKEWLYYNQLTFSLQAPQGHLPASRAFLTFGASLASRLVECNI
ncbi:MAG: GUN4 domain-containing protein [Rivularia sp. (in: cyanobacteria)]